MRVQPGLLVSVRSAEEAIAAVSGGAAVVDVKEPLRGPLGMAGIPVWQAVRAAVPAEIPVSVALGELSEWLDRSPPPRDAFAGIGFRKMGLAGAGPGWFEDWARIRHSWGDGPPWIAVIYADWALAGSPDPEDVIAAAAEARCAGVLIDTWEKGSRSPLSLSWADRVGRIQDTVGLVALAGGLDVDDIRALGPLAPDLFAVRGAACAGSDRAGTIDAGRVARLVAACGGA
ncbi:MAG: hypothetical protein JWN86_4670 [Planctomycetota bacterium]|nr:hypothetical protein [Planctomycetota bacterium]